MPEHLAEDAANGPQVDFGAVEAGAVEQLRRSVPARRHLVRELAARPVLVAAGRRSGEQPAQSKVGDLESPNTPLQ